MVSNFSKEEEKIAQRLTDFEQISLQQLEEAELLNREDSKYVFHISEFDDLLKELAAQYYILEIDGRRMFNYESLYFDTDDFLLYRFHHNGKLNRLKVRFRKYIDSGLTFFEVKYKVKGTRTDKIRMREADMLDELGEKELQLVHHDYADISGLHKKLWVYFKRITLLAKNSNERATLDIQLLYDNFRKKQGYPELVVAEIKQKKLNVFSPMIQAFKKRHFQQIPFSKYSTGIALLEEVKHNAFKPNFIKINKIINGHS